ncbi:entericidin EcnA/B family protein [Loktanella sp. PT4BL]|jgi:predicted small secreted protein|uniref:Entericidin EcnA/B family protein n=1 Tax=Yoonia rosea TaxID=287098 RepID=A0A1R3WED9_9RHOB|nr:MULTISPECIES: entericidin A/B family lipoprotein [Rhodobacterales]KQB97481.1 GTP-binding protein LepA [Loktanella sp. 1ANDIMAR09]PXW70982.1 entericidin EcnA/B family protein [Loktanella sp. PT4BL]SIT74785.1 Entericidin EcnA/B family protein [Yoonia rosea]HEV8034538.1 entericidin A/B family lipoprotein [Yoonia sp.]
MTRIALIIAILGLAACETVQGVGRDITNAGAAIDRSL